MRRQVTSLDEQLQAKFAEMAVGPASKFLLVGAGASAAVGLPTMSGFFERLFGQDFSERLSSGLVPSNDRNTRVLALVRTAYPVKPSPEVYDLERVMDVVAQVRRASAPESREVFRSLVTLWGERGTGRTYQDWSAVRRSVATEVATFLDGLSGAAEWLVDEFYRVFGCPDASSCAQVWLPCLRHLAEDSEARTLPVFTTNYDLAFETLAYSRSLPPGTSLNTGFREAAHLQTQVWDIANYSRIGPSAGVLLLKMHGSANWYWHSSSGTIRHQGLDNACKPPDSGDRALLQPLLTKGEPTEKWAREQYDALQVWLENARLCIAIGFSFRDDTILDMYDSALGQRKGGLRLVIVAPEDPQYEEQVNAGIRSLVKAHPDWVTRIPEPFGSESCLTAILTATGAHRGALARR